MKFKFDANQDFQIEAIDAVVGLFRGQARLTGGLEFAGETLSGLAAVPNRLDLDESALLANLHEVQTLNGIQSGR